MSLWVVDSSVAAKWFFPEVHSDESTTLLGEAHDLHAPDFFFIELDNLLCKRVRRNELDRAEARNIRQTLHELPVQAHVMEPLLDPAFEIALETGRSLYDCLYLALAVMVQGRMITADRRLFTALERSAYSGHVFWIGDVKTNES